MEKLKKTKSSDPCPQPGLSPDLAHGSELFVFFFGFLEVLAKLQKTMEKQKKQKKTKSSDPCSLPGLSPDLAHGSELFFFVFPYFFCMFFIHVYMLSSQYLSKNARFYNLHTCAPQAKLQKKTMENQTSFNDLYHD